MKYVSDKLSLKPKNSFLVPVFISASGFNEHIFQEYWGFGTFGAVWQGIILMDIAKKKIIKEIAPEYIIRLLNLILF